MGLAEKRRRILEERLKEIVPKMINMGVERILLFGSFAMNSVSRSSDIDLIVVMKTDKRFLDRIEEIYNHIRPNIALDLLVYTPEEFEHIQKTSPFLKSALRYGKILYEREKGRPSEKMACSGNS